MPDDELVELKDIISSGGGVPAPSTREEEKPVEPVPPKEEEVPLFVKVEKYEDLLSIIDEIRELSSRMEEIKLLESSVYEVMGRIRDATNMLENEMKSRLEEIDNLLVRPAGMRKRPRQIREFDSLLSELKSDLTEIRKEVMKLVK